MSTKTQLLDTAERLVRQRGYDGFSFSDLAEAVGIQKPSVHYHFATKGALATDLIARYDDAMRTKLARIDRASGNGDAKLRAFFRIYRDALGDGSEICLCAALTAGQQSLPMPARGKLQSFFDHLLDWLQRLVGPDAMSVLALAEGAQLLARARNDVTAFDHAIAPALAKLQERTGDDT